MERYQENKNIFRRTRIKRCSLPQFISTYHTIVDEYNRRINIAMGNKHKIVNSRKMLRLSIALGVGVYREKNIFILFFITGYFFFFFQKKKIRVKIRFITTSTFIIFTLFISPKRLLRTHRM